MDLFSKCAGQGERNENIKMKNYLQAKSHRCEEKAQEAGEEMTSNPNEAMWLGWAGGWGDENLNQDRENKFFVTFLWKVCTNNSQPSLDLRYG